MLAEDNRSGVVVVTDKREGRLLGAKLALLGLLGIKAKGAVGAAGAAGGAGVAGLAGTAGLAGLSGGSKASYVTVQQPQVLVLEEKHREVYVPVEATVIEKPKDEYYVVGAAPASVTASYAPVYVSEYKPGAPAYVQAAPTYVEGSDYGGVSASLSVNKNVHLG